MMIAARNAFLMSVGSSTPTARDYAQDGLVAMFDTIENVAFGVSDHSDRRVVNLVGGDPLWTYNLTEGTVFGENYITSQTASPFAANSFTKSRDPFSYIEVVFTPTTFKGEAFVFCLSKGYSFGIKHTMIEYRNATDGAILQPHRYSPNRDYAVFAHSPALGTRYTLCYACSGESMISAFCNGIELPIQGGYSSSLYAYTGNGVWGGQGGNTRTTPGWLMHSVRLYSRALTAAEVAANYAIDAARFNL